MYMEGKYFQETIKSIYLVRSLHFPHAVVYLCENVKAYSECFKETGSSRGGQMNQGLSVP